MSLSGQIRSMRLFYSGAAALGALWGVSLLLAACGGTAPRRHTAHRTGKSLAWSRFMSKWSLYWARIAKNSTKSMNEAAECGLYLVAWESDSETGTAICRTIDDARKLVHKLTEGRLEGSEEAQAVAQEDGDIDDDLIIGMEEYDVPFLQEAAFEGEGIAYGRVKGPLETPIF